MGITGERGTGKSELLRSFCEPPAAGSVRENEGTIGVIVAVPAAFKGLQFLMLVAERLAKAVPGYISSDELRVRRQRYFAYVLLFLSSVAMTAGLLGLLLGEKAFPGLRFTPKDGWSLVLAGGLICYVSSFFIEMRSRRSLTKFNPGRRPSKRGTQGAAFPGGP